MGFRHYVMGYPVFAIFNMHHVQAHVYNITMLCDHLKTCHDVTGWGNPVSMVINHLNCL